MPNASISKFTCAETQIPHWKKSASRTIFPCLTHFKQKRAELPAPRIVRKGDRNIIMVDIFVKPVIIAKAPNCGTAVPFMETNPDIIVRFVIGHPSTRSVEQAGFCAEFLDEIQRIAVKLQRFQLLQDGFHVRVPRT